NEDLQSVVAKVIKKAFKENATLSQFVEGIENDELETFILALTKTLKSVDDNLLISQKLRDEIKLELNKPLSDISFNKIVENLKTYLTAKFDNEHAEINIINLLKLVASSDVVSNQVVLQKIVKNIIKYLLSQDKNISKLVEYIYSKLNAESQSRISEETIKGFINRLLQQNEFDNLLDSLIYQLVVKLPLINNDINSYFDLLKLFASNLIYTNLYTNIINLNNYLKSDSTIVDLYNDFIVSKSKGVLNGIELSEFINVINVILENEKFKKIGNDFVNQVVFKDGNNFDSLKNIKELFKQWIIQNKNSLRIQISQIAKELIIQNDFKEFITTISFNLISKNAILSNNIKKPDFKKLIKAFLTKINDFDNQFNLFDNFTNSIIEQIEINGFNIHWDEIVQNLFAPLFNENNWETNILKIIKLITNDDLLSQNIVTIKQLISNFLDLLVQNNNLSNKIYEYIPEKIKNKISTHLSESDFHKTLQALFTNKNSIKNLINYLLDVVVANISDFRNSENLVQVLKIILNDNQKRQDIKDYLQAIISDLISIDEVKNLIKGLFVDNVAPYNINPNSPENEMLINDVLNELPSLLDNLGIISSMLNNMNNKLDNYSSLLEISNHLSDFLIDKEFFKNYSFIKTILNSNIIKKHKDTIKNDINAVIIGITSNDDLVEKFITDFGLKSLVTDLGLTNEQSTNLFKAIIKSANSRTILDTIVGEVLDNSDQYGKLNTWTEAINKFFNSSQKDNIKASLKQLLKEIFTKNTDVAYSIGKILANSLREKHYNLNQADDIKIQKFVFEIGKASFNTPIINDVVDSIFDLFKNFEQIGSNNFSEKFQKAIIKGATKFISNSDGVVELSKIFEKNQLFRQMFSEINSQTYVDFINLLFKASPPNTDSGIYNFMFKSNNNQNSNFKVGSGIWGILQGKFGELISSFVSPLVNSYLNELATSKNVYNNINELKSNSSGYQAIWRMYSFLAGILYSNTPSGLFWNATSLTAESYLMQGFVKAFEDNKNKYKTQLINKYKNNLDVIGFNNNYTFSDVYLSGYQVLTSKNWWGSVTKYNSRSNSLSKSFYGRDHTLIYIYYQNNNDIKYNRNKKFRDVLITDMINGYQRVEGN
uniref:hypothetical protein n=1 Tax=Mycoplasmopsis lipofaciens TaxID=114884 RepID=UPI0004867D65